MLCFFVCLCLPDVVSGAADNLSIMAYVAELYNVLPHDAPDSPDGAESTVDDTNLGVKVHQNVLSPHSFSQHSTSNTQTQDICFVHNENVVTVFLVYCFLHQHSFNQVNTEPLSEVSCAAVCFHCSWKLMTRTRTS